MATSSTSPSRLSPEQAINLATNQNFHQSNLGHLKYPYAQLQGDGTAATACLLAAGRPVSVQKYGSSINRSTRSPALTVSATEEQINLATMSSLVPNNVSPNTTYGQPSGFGLPYGSPFYQSYSETFPANHTGGVETDANEAAERRDSEATLKISLHPEDPFETTFTNFPIEPDSWSSAAFSSPSLESFNSSSSTQNDPSTFGTPSLGVEDSQHHPEELLLSATHSHNPQRLSPSLSFIPPPEPSRRERRGAISQQGCSAFVGYSKRPMLDDSTAQQLYAGNFQIEDSDNQFTPAVSRSKDQISTPSPFRRADSPSGPSAATHEPLASTCRDVRAEPAPASPGASAPGGPSLSKSVDSSRFHPYARPVKMSEHEQLIQFDNAPVVEPGRKASKRSKGSRRCYCKYVCPVKRKQCNNSVSREADMSRHLHKHRSEEAEMIAAGVLAPENATDFGDLKPTGAAICKGCGIPMSRKDALVRHLKKSGKSCRVFYPDVVLK
ncbi:hypothetical protein FRC06_003240 [Ceratobasidium sp. 370]|nr:hypothetical protein FRC06_003240 [Ceratobasidium sp. 370]